MNKNIAVLGSGAIGSSVSADLIKAGLDVTVIDQWPAHVEAMKADGLRVQKPDGELHVPVRALHLCDLASARLEFDIVFLCCKSNDDRWMVELIKPYLKSDGVLVPVQNGFNDDTIASIIGRERVVGCALELAAEIFTSGLVKRGTSHKTTWLGVGELDGRYTPRLREIETILSNVGRVDATGNIYSTRWSKVISNSMLMGPFGLLGLTSAEAANLPGMFDICVRLGTETAKVGEALGYRMEPIFGMRADDLTGSIDENLRFAMKKLLSLVSHARTAPIHDHLKGRTSEMDFIIGVMIRKGKELGIPTPCNEAVLEIDRKINQGLLKMDASNFELLRRAINQPG